MTLRALFHRLLLQEDLNFLLTNRIPRHALTRFMGWFSQIEQPLVRDLSIGVWKFFSDLDLSEAKKSEFKSLHECFIRELRDGARPVDPDPGVLVSPCDAIVGACGEANGGTLLQAKGFLYTLDELLGDRVRAAACRNGCYATLRLTSSMYHRFHAPHEGRVEQVNYISGDTWNVNPIALRRVEKLFCRNERAVISLRLASRAEEVLLVPVAAVLVASIRLHFVDVLLHLGYRGPNQISCDATFDKGQEMGWFQHGSTIIVIAPEGYSLAANVREGARLRVGEALMRLPSDAAETTQP